MAINSTDRRAKNVQILLKNAVETSFENGHKVIFLELWLKVKKQLLEFITGCS
jgi:hypothetical protein